MTLSIVGGLHKFCSDMFTEPDNHVVDPARVIAISACSVYIGMTIYDVIGLRNHFEYQNFGIGMGLILAALGAVLHLKPNSKGDGNA